MHFSLRMSSHTLGPTHSRILPPITESVLIPTGPDSSANVERAASWRAAEEREEGESGEEQEEEEEGAQRVSGESE